VSEPALRRADEADAAAIGRVVDAAYGAYGDLLGRTPFPMLADHALAIREHEVWVLDDDGTVIGVIELVPREDHLWVENVAIDPAHQGRGLGRRLLRHAEDEARRHGLAEIRLLTNERYTANIAMYFRHGYAETHREPCRGTDLVHFRKALPSEHEGAGDVADEAARA
jgi:N-acetylglutamate synthase-like GNAT family acetyltransferase